MTEDRAGGLLGHGVYTDGETATGRFTAYAETTDALDALVVTIRESTLTRSVWERSRRHRADISGHVDSGFVRPLLVEYDASRTINDALVSRGFVPDDPVRMDGGREYWTVVVSRRADIDDRLDAVRREMDAEISVDRVAPDRERSRTDFRTDVLSARQREILELARERGYYDWPRGVSVDDLATEVGIAKATALEHLRKAEAKLLGPTR